jgi:3-phenylpropionate/cinnamic acid dioxygenase small subunit
MTEALTSSTLMEAQFEISQFLYREARLLDERRWDEWLAMIADDVRYVAPVRRARMPREDRMEFEPADGGAHFDESKDNLAERVRKLQTSRAWSEVPASRTRHLITNVEVEVVPGTPGWAVHSAFLLYRTRSETYQDMFAGARQDVIRRRDDGSGDLELASRRILLDQTVLLGNNLSVFL